MFSCITGIHWRTDAQRLQQAFEPFGPILKGIVHPFLTPRPTIPHMHVASIVSFAPTQTENIYLTGCVSYKKADDAFRAILAMNGQELDGRLLKVDYYDGTLDD
ncbi:hypothetical protein DYB31_012415 [Aphanomyces astaci]|uniref:RRM domain-containing protein n=1 Tax=Aphanomyces astaci TaxID=112090 RepID=A0A397FMY7_APHAT|nr:hypothetical protein DYB31_012415 [Aphanomyces astaci]